MPRGPVPRNELLSLGAGWVGAVGCKRRRKKCTPAVLYAYGLLPCTEDVNRSGLCPRRVSIVEFVDLFSSCVLCMGCGRVGQKQRIRFSGGKYFEGRETFRG